MQYAKALALLLVIVGGYSLTLTLALASYRRRSVRRPTD